MTDTFDFDAYLGLPRLSGLRLPDGSRLVVTVARPARDGKKMRTSIWEVDPSGDRRPTRLTRSAPGESAGAFLRDGSLLFTSTRADADPPTEDEEDDETSRLWRLAPNGGEAHVLVTAAGGIEDVVTACDADVLCFSAGVFPGTTSWPPTRRSNRHARRPAWRRSCSSRIRSVAGTTTSVLAIATCSRRRPWRARNGSRCPRT